MGSGRELGGWAEESEWDWAGKGVMWKRADILWVLASLLS